MNGLKRTAMIVAALVLACSMEAMASGKCGELPGNAQLQQYLVNAASGTGISVPLGPGTDAGGLFGGALMWGAVVNRDGEICAYITSTADPKEVWPGSQAIAKAKAFTGNAFSNAGLPLSTARLYTLVQPEHSLFGLNNSNVFKTSALAPTSGAGGGNGQVVAGIITFGGGVPLYSGGVVVGGLGVSGDTACSDHEVAKRVRDLAGLNPPAGPLADDIIYASVDGANILQHPLCLSTKRNGVALGTELP